MVDRNELGRSRTRQLVGQQGTGDQAPMVNCGEECIEAWPLIEARGEVEAREDARAELIGTMQHNAQSVVTYNGWPL